MKPKRNQRDMDSAIRGLPYLQGSVTKLNWQAKAIEFMRMSGREDGSHPVIRNKLGAQRGSSEETPDQWVAWIAYWHELGMKTKFIEGHGVATVPAEYPWEFSQDADRIRSRIPQLLRDYEAPRKAASCR